MKKRLLYILLFAFVFFCSCGEVAPTEEKNENESTTEEHTYFNVEVLYVLEPNTSYKYTYDRERKIIYFLDENGNIYKINEDGSNKEMIFSGEKCDFIFINNIYYYDDFIYFLERESKAKGFYRIDPKDGNISKIEIDENIFGLYDIDQYIIYDNEIYLGKLYWGGIWAISLETLKLTYYGNIWGDFCFDTEYLYVLSGNEVYKISKEKKDNDEGDFEKIDTTFIGKYASTISRIYLSGEKIFYQVYMQTNYTNTDNPYTYDLYSSNKDGSGAKKINTGNEYGGILFEKSGYLYFRVQTNGYLYRISSDDETINQVFDLDSRNYFFYPIGDYLYFDEARENNEYNVMRININNFALEKIDWLKRLFV
ncbi:MAG: DUF5050 domain-containing protein [Oscillospiraceae bacterium]|nr:DUF5050 domain-containing protein [Oscillospiraceae bacterium]